MYKKDLVQDWMTPNPITIPWNTSVKEAHKLRIDHEIRRLPVMAGDRLVGIVTLGDVRGAAPSDATSLSVWELNYLISKLTVDRIMSHPVISARPDTTVREVGKLMLDDKIGGLPVFSGEKLTGIITESDIFRMLVDEWHWKAAGITTTV